MNTGGNGVPISYTTKLFHSQDVLDIFTNEVWTIRIDLIMHLVRVSLDTHSFLGH